MDLNDKDALKSEAMDIGIKTIQLGDEFAQQVYAALYHPQFTDVGDEQRVAVIAALMDGYLTQRVRLSEMSSIVTACY